MEHTFYKYQGTGNDFILIDNRTLFFDKSNSKNIAKLCNRRFGIGADGLILLENHPTEDFRMVYFNADGNESSMCGNGGRCITAFANDLGIIENATSFEAIDGVHNAIVDGSLITLQMANVETVKQYDTHIFLDTGSPHHVELVEDLDDFDVTSKGAALRYSSLYKPSGANINFVTQHSKNVFGVRTYERGVEDETLSCGTGVTAVALAMHYTGKTEDDTVVLRTPGGELQVSFDTNDNQNYHNIWLKGAALQVFKGLLPW